jgi:hypothetical protein
MKNSISISLNPFSISLKSFSISLLEPVSMKLSEPLSIALSILVLFVAIAIPGAGAATNNQAIASNQSTARYQSVSNSRAAIERSQYEMQSQHLTQMVPLAGVPQYTGQMVFVRGTNFPNAKCGSSLTLELKACETAEQVKDWYATVLQQSGWKLDSVMSNEHTVAAWQGNRHIQVITRKMVKDRIHCDVVIRYKDAK